MSARDYFRKIGAAIARRAVISVNDDDRAALAWHGGLRLRLIRPTGYGLTRGARSRRPSIVARMEPTGRANARPMINSAKSGAVSEIAIPDCAALHPGYEQRVDGRSDLSAVARRAKAEGGSDTHQLHVVALMGFAGLNRLK